LIADVKFITSKVNVRINLKKLNHNYPYCYLAGRHLTISVTTTRNIPWVEPLFLTLINSRLQQIVKHDFVWCTQIADVPSFSTDNLCYKLLPSRHTLKAWFQ